MRWTDSHCHLPYERLDDPPEEIDRARAAGVERLVTVGTDLDQSVAALDVASAHDGVWATVGLHPHDASDGLGPVEKLLRQAAAEQATLLVGVGECGLDYHYEHSPREIQREVFAAQIALAAELDLTLVIHSRDAWTDTFAVLDEVGVPARTVFHCFTGGPDEARLVLERGCAVSFSGIVSFPSAPEVREAAALVPADLLLVETDAPYLAPVPHRGRANHPAWVPEVGAAVADARGQRIEEVAEATWSTSTRLFRLPD